MTKAEFEKRVNAAQNVLKAAQAGLQFRKLIDSGKLKDTTQEVL